MGTGTKKTSYDAVSCLATSTSVTEAGRGDKSTKGAMERCLMGRSMIWQFIIIFEAI